MKLNTLFVAAVCASTLLNSCVFKTAQENQFQYTHTSLVDGDAFGVIQHVYEKAINGIQYAEIAEKDGDSKVIATKVKDFYLQFLPSLDSVANKYDVIMNPVPSVAAHTVDSLAAPVAQHNDSYVHLAQHDLAFVKEQLGRLTHNTNEDLQIFAKKQLEIISELYTQIGGKEEAHAHH